MKTANLSMQEALSLLKKGNERYVKLSRFCGDVSNKRRIETVEQGQRPYAIIIGCSDSRVIPEAVFSTGIGDLFVIRVAGNVVDDVAMGSVEYAVEHLGCKLAVVLGHTHCGAVDATCSNASGKHVNSIINEIRRAIGCETDKNKATVLNVKQSVCKIADGVQAEGFSVIGAIYDTETGRVSFDI